MLLYTSLKNIVSFALFVLVSRKNLLAKVFVLWQENICYKRYCVQHKITPRFMVHEKVLLHSVVILSRKALRFLSIVSPHTVLYVWKNQCAKFWTQQHTAKVGRKKISQYVKKIILQLKKDNTLWGAARISAELLKINIAVSRESIRHILNGFYRDGLLQPTLSWRKFLTSHWKTLFACDFFTVDIFGFTRLYVFFIIQLHTRQIVRWNLTANPDIPFLRKQLSDFSSEFPDNYLQKLGCFIFNGNKNIVFIPAGLA